MSTVKLASSDDQEFEIPKEIAEMSETLKNMLTDLGENEETEAIPLPNVNGETLSSCVEYCKEYLTRNQKDVSPVETNTADDTSSSDAKMKEVEEEEEEVKKSKTDTCELTDWEKTFFKDFENDKLFDFILASNYLDVKPALEAACKVVANKIKGKTPEEIRKEFDIENDFTPEEEEQIRKENEWILNED
jgi:S-phase kinase-associated protein 1